MKLRTVAAAAALTAIPWFAQAADITVRIHAIDAKGTGNEIGFIRAVDTDKGLLLVPRLKGLSPGMHGFHVHTNPDCGPKDQGGQMVPGLAAAGHWDPDNAGKHLGPTGAGHKGDLPFLTVEADGTAKKSITIARLKVADLGKRALMIHGGGDNYADQPAPLGGGGPRVACGVVR